MPFSTFSFLLSSPTTDRASKKHKYKKAGPSVGRTYRKENPVILEIVLLSASFSFLYGVLADNSQFLKDYWVFFH
jgi:hypothetical protein